MKCRACGFEHSPLVRCEQAKRQRERAEAQAPVVANAKRPKLLVANTKPEVVHIKREVVANAPAVVANAESRHGKYADQEKRRAYMRELMRAKRAAAKQA